MLKILLIDDEKTVLDGICFMLGKHYNGYEVVSAVQSAAQGLAALGERGQEVNLVITDVRMPRMDGIEVVKTVKANYPHIQTIVLSAYSDYDYVREALRLGAFDYLLKPCGTREFITALNKVRVLLEKAAGKELRERMARALEQEILGSSNSAGLFEPGAWVQMITVQSDSEAFTGQLDEWLGNRMQAGVCVPLLIKGIRVFVLDNALSYNELNRMHTRWNDGQAFLAVRAFVYSAGNLAQCFDTCLRMLETAKFNDITYALNEELWERCQQRHPADLVEQCSLREDFHSFFATGDSERLLRAVDTKIKVMMAEEHPFDPARIKKYLFGELMALDAMLDLRQSGMEEILGKSVDYLYELDRLRSRGPMLNWYQNLCAAVARHHESGNKPSAYIRDAVAFIEENYMRGLELKEVADHVFLNEWYFSSQFKKNLGVSFSEYLNQVRIRHAKELLRQKDMKICQIAGLVGFQDQAYFSQVFKRFVSLSPKRYQASLARKR